MGVAGEDEETFRANRAAWAKFVIRPKILTDVSAQNLATSILGRPLSLPLCFAPVSFHSLAAPELAEIATVRAGVTAFYHIYPKESSFANGRCMDLVTKHALVFVFGSDLRSLRCG